MFCSFYHLDPVMVHVMTPPFLKNIKPIALIFRGTWPTMVSLFMIVIAYGSSMLLNSRRHESSWFITGVH